MRETEVCPTAARDFSIQPVAPINQKTVLPIAYSTLAAEVIKDWLFAAVNAISVFNALFDDRNVGKIIWIPG